MITLVSKRIGRILKMIISRIHGYSSLVRLLVRKAGILYIIRCSFLLLRGLASQMSDTLLRNMIGQQCIELQLSGIYVKRGPNRKIWR